MRTIPEASEVEFGYQTFVCDVLLTHHRWPSDRLEQWSVEVRESAPPVDASEVDETETFF